MNNRINTAAQWKHYPTLEVCPVGEQHVQGAILKCPNDIVCNTTSVLKDNLIWSIPAALTNQLYPANLFGLNTSAPSSYKVANLVFGVFSWHVKHFHGSDDRNTIGTICFYPFLVSAKLHIKWKTINTQRRTRGHEPDLNVESMETIFACCFFHPQDGHTDFFLIYFFCSSVCVTSEALQYQRKSHMVSYFIHSSSSVFFCLPPTQRSLCCFHSLPTYLSSPLSFLALFMMGTPSPPRLWSRGLQRKLCTDPLLLCSPFAPSWSSSPLFTHQ